MGPSTQQVDNTPTYGRQTEADTARFAQGFMNNPTNLAYNPFLQLMATLGGGANGLSVNAGAYGNPEGQAFQLAQSMLPNMMVQGRGELSNPFGDLGAMNPAEQVVLQQLPLFGRALGEANRQLSNSAPGRYSTAFYNEGTDLGTRALQDFNSTAAQALLQGKSLQEQDRQSALNFMLGARGLAQQGDVASAQAAQQAAALMGQLGGQAANGAFGRDLAANQFRLSQQQAVMNPTLQLLLSGMQMGTPSGYQTIVGPSPFQQVTGGLTDLASLAFMGSQLFGGGGQQAPWGNYTPNMGAYGAGGDPTQWGWNGINTQQRRGR